MLPMMSAGEGSPQVDFRSPFQRTANRFDLHGGNKTRNGTEPSRLLHKQMLGIIRGNPGIRRPGEKRFIFQQQPVSIVFLPHIEQQFRDHEKKMRFMFFIGVIFKTGQDLRKQGFKDNPALIQPGQARYIG